eukprot:TRINITY_DN14013_c0_g1_i1.p1 TRINITY_DN14013_c0_g1~~TRINITY_DN14013_c0_g1_i1.p1  ORF type:complete len:196 (-),score=21.58 TRINITY_DN14013_c0_g1_i1:157-744(-)
MLYGYPPFSCENPMETYNKIINWETNLEFPADTPISQNARGTILSLLATMDTRVKTLGDMTNLPWFSMVDWNNLRERPAAIPVQVKSIDDTSYFDNFPEVQLDIKPQNQQQEPPDTKSAGSKDWMFLNYTFKRFEGLTQRGKLEKKFRLQFVENLWSGISAVIVTSDLRGWKTFPLHQQFLIFHANIDPWGLRPN